MGAGKAQDVTPGPDSGFNVRTRVHEYGGGEFVLSADAVYFSNFKASGGCLNSILSSDIACFLMFWQGVAALSVAHCPVC